MCVIMKTINNFKLKKRRGIKTIVKERKEKKKKKRKKGKKYKREIKKEIK